MEATFVWKEPVIATVPTEDVKSEIAKRLDNLSLTWSFNYTRTQRIYVRIESESHLDALRAIYRLSAPIHSGSRQLVNDRVEIVY